MSDHKYVNFNQFVLRVPLLPLNYIQSIFSDKQTSDKELKEICTDVKVNEALFLASPVLHSQINKWLNHKLSDFKDIERLKESITKYLLRMGSRCTPFGLFVGYQIGNFSSENNISLGNSDEHYSYLRLDMNYLCALAIDLAKIPVIKEQLKFFPNTSIYKSGDKLRYVEYKYINSRRNHYVIAVDNSEYLELILNETKRGLKINDLANLLVDDEISIEEATEFIDELIDSQLLVSELEPSVTGDEFLHQMIDTLESLQNIDPILKILKEIEGDLERIRNNKLGISSDHYIEISEKLKKLETKYELKFLFQTDMVVSAKQITLNKEVACDVLKGIEIMNRLTPSRTNDNLTKFKEAFYERYEEREIPLLQALDIESGVGFLQNTGSGDINPLVDDITLPSRSDISGYNINWHSIHSFLLEKYNSALKNNQDEVEIKDGDVDKFELNWDDLPSTFNAMVEIIDAGNEEKKPTISFSSAGGSSAANLLGRFCHSSDELFRYVNHITNKEKEINQHTILAEIVHLPESRTGNILSRPKFREYEIPYLAKSSVTEENQISLDDIYVSVKQGRRIVLRSKRLNKEIIPRLSNAHNFSANALPVYQFLCELQTQDLRSGVGFNWGALSNEYKYLPRVRYKNIILSEATWNFKKEDIKSMIESKSDDTLLQETKKWKNKFNLPDYVLLADGDNELLIHLNNLLCINTLLSLVKKRSGFKIKEFLFDGSKVLVKKGSDSFTNQVVFSFYKTMN